VHTRWIVTLSGLTALLVAALAVATNIATNLLPDNWDWVRNGALMWTVVGVLTSVVVMTTAVGTRLSLPARAAGVTNLAPRNPHFTGRVDHLAQLGRVFRARAAVAVLQGLGGSGKTQTALEYAQQRQERRRYDIVWWIRAESELTIAEDIAALAPALGLPDHDDRRRTIAEVHRALRDRRWLLIFDNAAEARHVRSWIVPGAGHTLVTTRQRTFGGLGPALEVGTFTRPESLAYLRSRTGRDEPRAAELLASELGDLPLALAQAAAAIDVSLDAYLARFRARRSAATELTAGLADYPESVATTWLLQFDQLGPAARDLLRYCAHLDVDDIDLTAVTGGLRPRPAPATVDALVASALVNRIGPDRLRMHRLVADVTRHELAAAANHAAAMVVRILHRLFPDQPWEPATWPACGRLAGHVLAATCHPGTRIREAGALLNRQAIYLEYRAEYTLARTVSFRALGIAEDCFGRDHPEVATAVLNLAQLDKLRGDLTAGIALVEDALETFDSGEPRQWTAGLLVMLGNLYADTGRHDRAVETLQRARQMTGQVYPPGHPAIDNVLVNLASAQQAVDPPAALATIRQVETIGAPDDPETAILLTVHAQILARLGDRPTATILLRNALKINTMTYGLEHPVTQESRTLISENAQ